MNKFHGSIVLVAFCLSCVYCAPSYADGSTNNGVSNSAGMNQPKSLLSSESNDAAIGADDNDLGNYPDKRVERYAFGLGRRAYTYTNAGGGMKRLPIYNFGLGKRARPYSFGLGKRVNADYEDEHEYDNDLERNAATYMAEEKRRPYSFGLGKRGSDDVDRRGFPNRYGFGLGRR